MKKSLLLGALAAFAASASAETQVYWFTADKIGSEFDIMGQFYSFSENGEYGIITDEEMEESFLWRKSDPQKLQLLNWKTKVNKGGQEVDWQIHLDVRGINDAGTIVGSYMPYDSNSWVPFYQPMGEDRIELPVPVWTKNLNFPCAISNNGNIIGGYLGGIITSKTLVDKDGNPETWGGSWPVIWAKGADGEFECHVNENLDMPDNQGFPVNCMYTDGTLDGTWLGGSLFCGAGATIAGLYNKGELKMWNELSIVSVPWIYKGQVMGYDKYEAIDGKIDMHYSDSDIVAGGIYCADHSGNFYGTRFHVGDLDEDPESDTFGLSTGDYYTWGYYNTQTDEWTEVDGREVVNCALEPKVFFVGQDVYKEGINSTPVNMASEFGFSTSKNWLGVTKASLDGKVLGFCYTAIDNAGVEHMYPFLVMLDEPLSGVEDIVVDADSHQLIIISGNTIEVTGANEVAVYDLNGVKVSDSAVSTVESGVYVVVADGTSHKILVK